VLMYGDVGFAGACREEERGPNAGARQVASDLTHLVNRKRLWNLSGLDLTLGVPESGHSSVESDRHLTARVIVSDR
jgi:hypothetical protein